MKNIPLLFLFILVVSCSAVGIRNYEEPKYETTLKEGKFEVREYSDMLIAQTTSAGNYKESSGENFERLAGYIFGKNKAKKKMAMTTPAFQKEQSEKMAMTTPVFQQQSNTSWTMTFVLPSQYSIDTIPIPLDENVSVNVLPKVKVATLQFSGRLNEGNITKHTQILENWVMENNFMAKALPYSAAYDPPWALPLLRRNEIHIPIE
ncbi:MAG: heme-binding protein [Pseudomonadota bacterium]